MNKAQIDALTNPCRSQEDLQKVWDSPQIYAFGNAHLLFVTLCVSKDGPKEEFVWSACVRIANHKKRNFKSVALWTTQQRLKARSVLLDQLNGVGVLLGEEEFSTTKGLHLNRRLSPEERSQIFLPHLLGH